VPAVTVIVPTLNRRHLLPRALASIAAQSYPNIEVVLVNDAAAQEGVGDIAKAWSRNLRVTFLDAGGQPGLASTRNRGVGAAGGQLIAYLDDDDEFRADHVELAVDALRTTGADAVVAPVYCSHRRGGPLDLHFNYRFDADLLLSLNPHPVIGLVHRRVDTDDRPLFDVSLRVMEDWEMMLFLNRGLGLRFTDQLVPSTIYHRTESSLTGLQPTVFRDLHQVIAQRWSPEPMPEHLAARLAAVNRWYAMRMTPAGQRGTVDYEGFLKTLATTPPRQLERASFQPRALG
jgi:glycosyltransferase involved in cell wall biosynthesis